MPQYYNPGLFPATYMPMMPNNAYGTFQQPQMSGAIGQPTYMYQVDGENAARSWTPPNGQQLPPNIVIPLFDADGYHVYFKTTDGYGRVNPIRKGYVVFEDDKQQLPEAKISESAGSDMSQYVTKDDLDAMRQEIMNALSQNNQNGRRNVPSNGQSYNNKGGENR